MCQSNHALINDSSLKLMSETVETLEILRIVCHSIHYLFIYYYFSRMQCRSLPEYARNRSQSATVTILPEIVLPDPICGYDSNSLSRFRSIERLKLKLQNYECKSLRWPQFVYKMYDVVEASKKIQEFLLTLKIGWYFSLFASSSRCC